MSENEKCVGCKSTEKALRHCADDKLRCATCRREWLDHVHSTPVKAVPPSIGEQARF